MSTKVKIIGFEIKPASNISFNDLFQAIKMDCGKEGTIKNKITYSLCGERDHYMAGIVLSYKGDRKNLTTLKEPDGKLRVEKSTLRKGQYSTEANIFCINPVSLKGVIYQYSGSLSAGGFYDLLNNAHKRILKAKIEDKIQELTNFGLSKVSLRKARKKAREFYKGKLELVLLIKPLDIDEIARRLPEINEVEIKASSALDDAPLFAPLNTFSKRVSVKVGVEQPKDASLLVTSIKELTASLGISPKDQALKLVGKNARGEHDWYYLGQNLTHYGTVKYDEYIDQLPETVWDEYVNCSALSDLMMVVRNHGPTFGPAPGPKNWPYPVDEETQEEAQIA